MPLLVLLALALSAGVASAAPAPVYPSPSSATFTATSSVVSASFPVVEALSPAPSDGGDALGSVSPVAPIADSPGEVTTTPSRPASWFRALSSASFTADFAWASYRTVWIVALAFTLPTLVISFAFLHRFVSRVQWSRRRRLNTCVIRILLMVPVYAVTSMLGLRFPELALYVRTLRECYEALALYSFFLMLILVLGGSKLLVRLLQTRPVQYHLWPFCCFPAFEMGAPFLWHMEFGTLQFVVVKPLLSLAAFICSALGVYGEGSFSPRVAYPYISCLTSLSQAYAIYCLALFYLAVAEELRPIRPVPKFLAIKLIIFFTYWQVCTPD